MKAWFKEQGIDENGMGSIGKITGLKDLPPNKVLTGYLKQAAAFVDDGAKTMQRPKKAATPRPRNSRRTRRRPQEEQGRAKSLDRLQPKLPARVRRMDHRSQARRNKRKAHRPGHRVDRRRQAAQLEVSELLAV